MKPKTAVLKVTLCGPMDVSKEIELATQIIREWNLLNWETTSFGLEIQHWSTNSAPDMIARGQRVIDSQLIDQSDLLVAIFWSRLGTPTGLSESGSVEEVERAIHRGIRTMVYFSDLEAPMEKIDQKQLRRLETFRKKVMATGLAETFSSRRKFEEIFRRHLALAVNEIIANRKSAKKRVPKSKKPSVSQSGSGNTLVVGDGNIVNTTPARAPKISIGPIPGQITPKEQKTVSEWIEELATLTEKVTKKSFVQGKQQWWSILLNKFHVPRYNALSSDQMPAVRQWFLQEKAKMNRSPKARRTGISAVDWMGSIKAKMRQMGRTNSDYYPEIATRLKLRAFGSLTELKPKDLERVYNLVKRDANAG